MGRLRIVVIGSGPGGLTAAVEASRLGAGVTLIEKDELGGVCLNKGCIPTKTLLTYGFGLKKAKKFFNEIERELRPDWSDWIEAQKEKETQVLSLRKDIEQLLQANRIKIIIGKARFWNQNTLSVLTADGQYLDIQADKTIIATGSGPKKPTIFDWNNPAVLDTTAALELERVPENLVVIGGGVNGLEFATMFNFFGTAVTIVEMEETLLPGFDQRISREIASHLKSAGIKIICGKKCVSLEPGDGEQKLRLDDGQELVCEKILVAIGRVSNTRSLDLKSAGIQINDRGYILINGKMETNVPGVYAVGDVAEKSFLANVAMMEGKVAARNAMAKEAKMDYSMIPKVIWTYPEIAAVGLTEKEAAEKGIETEVSRSWFKASPMAQIKEETKGFVQVVVEKSTEKILGAQIIGPDASNLIHIFAPALKKEINAIELAQIPFAHPTLAEAIRESIDRLISERREDVS